MEPEKGNCSNKSQREEMEMEISDSGFKYIFKLGPSTLLLPVPKAPILLWGFPDCSRRADSQRYEFSNQSGHRLLSAGQLALGNLTGVLFIA